MDDNFDILSFSDYEDYRQEDYNNSTIIDMDDLYIIEPEHTQYPETPPVAHATQATATQTNHLITSVTSTDTTTTITTTTTTTNDDFNNIFIIPTNTSKPKLIIKKKIITSNPDKELNPDNNSKATPIIDNKFIFNEETIATYTQDKNITTKSICIKKSPCKNDTILLCLLFKEHIFTEYKCCVPKCKVGKTWNTKPIQLLINRKNSKLEDLTISNLELICPNCFIIQYGIELFQKTIAQTIYKCTLCDYPLYKFSNFKKKAGYCNACEAKLITSSYYSKQNEYISELKNTLEDNSIPSNIAGMLQHAITDFDNNSTYFNEVSQYKSFNKVARKSKTPTNISAHLTPINNINNINKIVLNMSLPEIDYD